MKHPRSWLPAVPWLICSLAVSAAQPLVLYDFAGSRDVRGWRPTHHVGEFSAKPEGLVIPITGVDPYITSPRFDVPDGQPLWLNIRLKSDEGGMLQAFWFRDSPREADSAREIVAGAGQWVQTRIPVPPLGKGYRLRIDPPGHRGTGSATIAHITIERRQTLAEPAWPVIPVTPVEGELRLKSGDVELTHAADALGRFQLKAAGPTVAQGLSGLPIGYLKGDQPQWVDPRGQAKVNVTKSGDGLAVSAAIADADGGNWKIEQRFTTANVAGGFDVKTTVTVDQDREIVFLPLLLISAGAGDGSFGLSKTQALFPGLEYLDRDEPSSSEADIIGPGSRRQVPDTLKITIPLACVVANGRYVGVTWDMADHLSAVFDSPDRLLKTGGHLMGLIAPGSDGKNRAEGSWVPRWPTTLRANRTWTANARIVSRPATSAVDAVRDHVAERGLPDLPRADVQTYVKTAAAGWLDSRIREGDHFRHAWPGDFRPHPAADAAVYTAWLAAYSSDAQLASRLRADARDAIAQVEPPAYHFAAVSHIRHPLPSLVFGHTVTAAEHVREHGRRLVKRFDPDGTVKYKPGKSDFGKTHFAPEANGFTAQVVQSLLEDAVFSGDTDLIKDGLRALRALDKFDNTVPRGAQTWEIPLHTPDILASAHLVKAYTIGYELTGEAAMLERARYWAWTGVPFVYLRDPANQPIGRYATIAVLGATNWNAPNWMGLPVQWCGLVYADALYRLAPHDSQSPWTKLADGIVISGIQQTWPHDHPDIQRRGLLPDSIRLRDIGRQDAAINPGTVQANASRALRLGAPYSFQSIRRHGLLIHVPGDIKDIAEGENGVSLAIKPWPMDPCHVLIAGCKTRPAVTINAMPFEDYEWSEPNRWLLLRIRGEVSVQLKMR